MRRLAHRSLVCNPNAHHKDGNDQSQQASETQLPPNLTYQNSRHDARCVSRSQVRADIQHAHCRWQVAVGICKKCITETCRRACDAAMLMVACYMRVPEKKQGGRLHNGIGLRVCR